MSHVESSANVNCNSRIRPAYSSAARRGNLRKALALRLPVGCTQQNQVLQPRVQKLLRAYRLYGREELVSLIVLVSKGPQHLGSHGLCRRLW